VQAGSSLLFLCGGAAFLGMEDRQQFRPPWKVMPFCGKTKATMSYRTAPKID
jgi:hypothetical protein